MISGMILAISLAGVVPAGQPTWTTSYAKAVKTARENGQRLVLVIDNPSDASTVSATSYVHNHQERLANAVLCRIDGTTEGGRKLAARYKAATLPYLVISDKRCSVIRFQKAGPTTPGEWNHILATYLRSDQPTYSAAPANVRIQPQVYQWYSQPATSYRQYCPT